MLETSKSRQVPVMQIHVIMYKHNHSVCRSGELARDKGDVLCPPSPQQLPCSSLQAGGFASFSPLIVLAWTGRVKRASCQNAMHLFSSERQPRIMCFPCQPDFQWHLLIVSIALSLTSHTFPIQ